MTRTDPGYLRERSARMMIAQDFDAPFSSLCDERRLYFERLDWGVLILISICCYTARRGIGVSCVTARRKIYTVCDNAASDIAAAMAEF